MFGFANGMSGSLFCSLATAVGYRLAAYGTRGCAEVATTDLEFRFTATPEAEPAGRRTQPAPEIIAHPGFNALLAELEAFAAAIDGAAPYPIPPEEVLHGVAVFEAIVRSAATRQPVRVARE
jgi:predicted dehydrogenase